MKEKLKIIIKIASFALCFFLLVNVFSLVFMPKDGNKNVNGMVRYVTYGYRSEPKNSLDVVMVGNSDLYRAFSPMEMWQQNGITSYVCGSPLQTPEISYSLLKEIFFLHKPKVVVLEVDELFTSSNPTTKKSSNKPNKKPNPIKKAYKYLETYDKNIGTKTTYNYPLIKYHNRWDKLTRNDFFNLKDSWYFVGRGYLLNKEISPYDGDDGYMAPDDGFEEMRDGAEKSLKKILSLCEKNDAQLMLAVMPSANTWNYKKHNTIAQYADQNGLEFLDLNTMLNEIDFDWTTDTKDKGNHLNLFGGTKVTKKVADFLSETYLIEKRTDPELVERWERDLKIYLETKERVLI